MSTYGTILIVKFRYDISASHSIFRRPVTGTNTNTIQKVILKIKHDYFLVLLRIKLACTLYSTFGAILLECDCSINGTHARDFHNQFLNFFLHLSVTNRYKTQYSQHFRKYSSNSPRYSKFSITRRFRRKREAWLSVVAEYAELNLALSA